MVRTNGLIKGLFKIILVIVIICALVFTTAFFTTPSTFGIQNEPIFGGNSFSDYGFENVSFFKMYELFKGMATTTNDHIVSEDEKPNQEDYDFIDNNIQGAKPVSTGDDSSSNFDFGDLLDGNVYFEEEKEIELTPQQMAALFNSVLTSDGDSPMKSIQSDADVIDLETSKINLEEETKELTQEDLKEFFENLNTRDNIKAFFATLNIKIDKTTAVNDGKGNIQLETNFSLELPKEIQDRLKSMPIEIASEQHFILTNQIQLKDGRLILVRDSRTKILFNSLSEYQTKQLMSLLMKTIIEQTESNVVIKDANGAYMETGYFCGEVLIKIINNLGEIESFDENGLRLKTRIAA